MINYHHENQKYQTQAAAAVPGSTSVRQAAAHDRAAGTAASHQSRCPMKLAKYKVYYNLHKKCLSMMYRGKVISHAVEYALKNVDFRVSAKGRERVLKNHRKNVHAFVCGEQDEGWPVDQLEQKVIYNPYKYKSFVRADTKRPIYHANYAFVIGKDIYVLN